jgi:L-threonylcarbamoyladenylate synthase
VIISETIESLRRIAKVINQGGVIAFRTDTFYGLGANPFNRDAIRRIKELKGREGDKPILIVISDRDQVKRFIPQTSDSFDRLAEKFWPGPLTIIGPARAEVPTEITAGTDTIGIRLPDDDDVRNFVRACGGALTATSANPSGEAPAHTADEVRNYFGEAMDLIVDAGEARTEAPSTVVKATAATPRLVREGVILWSTIQAEM